MKLRTRKQGEPFKVTELISSWAGSQCSLSLPQTLLFFPPHKVCFLSKRVVLFISFFSLQSPNCLCFFFGRLTNWLQIELLLEYSWSGYRMRARIPRNRGKKAYNCNWITIKKKKKEYQETISSSPVPKMKKELYVKVQDGWKRNWDIMRCSPPSPTQGTAQLPGTCDVLCNGLHRAENIQRVLRIVLSECFPSEQQFKTEYKACGVGF